MTEPIFAKKDIKSSRLPTDADIREATDTLRKGGLIVFPTETVYGIGARAFDPAAVKRIFQVKGRPPDNPLIVHVATPDQVSLLALDLPPITQRLMDRFWPGPLTLIFKRNPALPAIVSAHLNTVAVRIPDHPVALALLRRFGEPIAAPSANRSGRPSPTTSDHARSELGHEVDCILDGGHCSIGLESTVLDLTADPPSILRPGPITEEMLSPFVGALARPENGPARSPGTKHRHYAPNLSMVLFTPQEWPLTLQTWRRSGKRIGMLCRHKIDPVSEIIYYRRFHGDESHYARHIYLAIREAEAASIEVLLVEGVAKHGLGTAIMDRLERAQGKS